MITEDINYIPFLCQRCGACSLVCPLGAITLFSDERGLIYPQIDYEKCDGCKKCYEVCPARLERYSTETNFLGRITASYAGWSSDIRNRFLGSSGGIITAISKWALERGVIDALISVISHSQFPWLAEFSIISTIREIEKIRSSRYISIDLSRVFRDPVSLRNFKRVAFIGLGCHIRALENLKRILNIQNIHFTIGLICKQTKDIRLIDYILDTLNIDKEDIKEFSYRTQGYPGKTIIKLKDGSQKEYSYKEWAFLWSNFYFAPRGCIFCTDPLAEFADIVVGDPWLPRFKNEKVGVSLIFSRTPRGREIIQGAFLDRFINITPLSPKEILYSQNLRFLKFKRGYLTEKFIFLKLLKIIKTDFPGRKLKLKNYPAFLKIFNIFRIYLSCRFLELPLSLKIFRKISPKLFKILSLLLRI